MESIRANLRTRSLEVESYFLSIRYALYRSFMPASMVLWEACACAGARLRVSVRLGREKGEGESDGEGGERGWAVDMADMAEFSVKVCLPALRTERQRSAPPSPQAPTR